MKNNKTTPYLFAILLLIVTGIIYVSCNKKFDEPPAYIPPDIEANLMIKDLKARHIFGNFELITEEQIIEGIVVADDKSGNFYKSIVIQDATGGITIRLDGFNLYTDYPVGRKIYIKLKGLYIGDYNRMIQIGGGIDNTGTIPAMAAIASSLFSKYIVKGTLGNIVAPKAVTTLQLADSLQSMLIQLDNFEFAPTDTAKTYGDTTLGSSSRSFAIKNCEADIITLRNSSYADFAGYNVPNGNGSIVAIYTVFGTARQLAIRDTADLKFNKIRCGIGNVFNEDFSGESSGAYITIPGWVHVSETGTIKYKGATLSGNLFAKISAFGLGQINVKTWLITPAVDLSGHTNTVFAFQNADGYDNGATLKIYISKNYDGISLTPWSSALWTPLNANISSGHTTGYGPFISSGNISLNAFSGKVYFAFVYQGSDDVVAANDKTTTFEIDNVRVNGD